MTEGEKTRRGVGAGRDSRLWSASSQLPGETLYDGPGKLPGGWEQRSAANRNDMVLFRTSGSSEIISFGYFFWMRKLVEVPRTY